MYFENKVGPGKLQFSLQETYNRPVKISHNMDKIDKNELQLVCAIRILPPLVFVECWIGELQVRSRFQTALLTV